MTDYFKKYLKYKNKYLSLKKNKTLVGGGKLNSTEKMLGDMEQELKTKVSEIERVIIEMRKKRLGRASTGTEHRDSFVIAELTEIENKLKTEVSKINRQIIEIRKKRLALASPVFVDSNKKLKQLPQQTQVETKERNETQSKEQKLQNLIEKYKKLKKNESGVKRLTDRYIKAVDEKISEIPDLNSEIAAPYNNFQKILRNMEGIEKAISELEIQKNRNNQNLDQQILNYENLIKTLSKSMDYAVELINTGKNINFAMNYRLF